MYKLNREQELPPVDMFVTTADPVLEPPIITVNTVLSLMALDYPANKLACYVSDDGCSPLNFYALVEASKLAKLWVPFCKKYNVKVRAPFKYFPNESVLSSTGAHDSWEFHQDWKKMKEEYEGLRRNIEDAATRSAAFGFDLAGELAVFSNIEPRNHTAIVKRRGTAGLGLDDEVFRRKTKGWECKDVWGSIVGVDSGAMKMAREYEVMSICSVSKADVHNVSNDGPTKKIELGEDLGQTGCNHANGLGENFGDNLGDSLGCVESPSRPKVRRWKSGPACKTKRRLSPKSLEDNGGKR
ncbi:hypothetical protein JRO89_XS01G0135700 [Xanthoceras sorbifolium]|uniref:Cellulose synthase n=1 Tax=Xanthoceras sorbifolium TaxID=99658 RepID=A0ABQ8IJA3_9ROSI|nr:hypothetical protein JRO89_XS01G0135700 [Xanthoceras sorbifolium]